MEMSNMAQLTEMSLARAFSSGRIIDISMDLNERTVVWTGRPATKADSDLSPARGRLQLHMA